VFGWQVIFCLCINNIVHVAYHDTYGNMNTFKHLFIIIIIIIFKIDCLIIDQTIDCWP